MDCLPVPVRLDPGLAGAAARLEASCFPSGWSAEQYREQLEAGQVWGRTLPDEESGELAGYIVVSSVLDEMEILNVAVRPALRGRGLAGALLASVLQEALERGIKKCLLEVRTGNAPARALYARAGFKPAGIRKRYYSDSGEDALVMTLDLDSRPPVTKTE